MAAILFLCGGGGFLRGTAASAFVIGGRFASLAPVGGSEFLLGAGDPLGGTAGGAGCVCAPRWVALAEAEGEAVLPSSDRRSLQPRSDSVPGDV